MNHSAKIHLVEIESLLEERNIYKIPDNEFVAWLSQHATVMVTRVIVDGIPWSNLRVEEYRDRRYYEYVSEDDDRGQFVKAYLERIDAANSETEREAIRNEYENCEFNKPIFNPFTLKSIHRRKNWRPDFHIDPIRFNSEFKQFYGYLNN